MSQLPVVSQSGAPGALVSLFTLDATSVGGGVYYFCSSALANEGGGPVFNGKTYVPVDVEFTGFETTGVGALPQPKIKLSNINGVFQQMINTYGDLVGCKLSRLRTFDRFLDGQPQADPSAFYGPDTFRIEQKLAENPLYIQWSLSAAIDEEGKMLPGRQILRDTCLWRYRYWNGNAFDYSKAQCPYTGGNYFDKLDNPTGDASKDQCSRHLTGCQKRFGADNPLPYGGFPGVARTTIPGS